MEFSYWELKEWFSQVDFTIVGSGIVGLNCAISLQDRYPSAKIVVLEKGMLPQGASTKNAGFACFGSLSELLDDLQTHSEQEVLSLVQKRWDGLQLLRKTLGDKAIDFQQKKGYELFTDEALYQQCFTQKSYINQLLDPVFKAPVFSVSENTFGFQKICKNYGVNAFEGQIDTGKMMAALLAVAQKKGIRILNNCTVTAFTDTGSQVGIQTKTHQFNTRKLVIATNGFAQQLLTEKVQPARAQVLVTEPIKDLHIEGTFHLDKGYYYFRNIDQRILFGGGRNLDFTTEETTEFGQTETVQKALETILRETILPNTPFEVAHRWSGIMGIGTQKKAIVKPLSTNVVCGVRLGGMGVAIGSLVGQEAAKLL